MKSHAIRVSELAYKLLNQEKKKTNIPIKYIVERLVKEKLIRRAK